MLQYKCDSAGVWFEEVDERYSTQSCSCCESRTGPTGQTALGIREWACPVCQASHERDINAAKNILRWGVARIAKTLSIAAENAEMNKAPSPDDARAGRGPLAEGISVL